MSDKLTKQYVERTYSNAISTIDRGGGGVAWYLTSNRYRDQALVELHAAKRLMTGIDSESGFRWVMKMSKKTKRK